MKLRNKLGVIVSIALAGVAFCLPGIPQANAAETWFQGYGIDQQQSRHIVVDSNMSYEEAMGDAVVPAQYRELHAKMKPYLRIVTVLYHGYDGRIHRGQIVVHRDLVRETRQLFCGMFRLGFPIQSVIPESRYGYDDERSMEANNSSNYRPERLSSGNLSEHAKGAAYDLNPFTNPFDVLNDDGTRTIQPAGAHYDPTAMGAIYKTSPVRKLWTSFHYTWGGGWGDPEADPPTDFYKIGFFDYQHFNLDYSRDVPLPPGI